MRAIYVSILVITVFLSAAASAESDCAATSWFPDFACDDRQARFDGFIPPASMPYLFEDPFITTEVQGHGIWHQFPSDSVFQGGDLWVMALQLRLAITDRLAFIATKDGFAFLRPDSDSAIPSDQGFFDLGLGFKYALYQDPENQAIISPALRMDIPAGNIGVFSGNGAGVIIPSVSGAKGFDDLHLIGNLGFRVPFNQNQENNSMFYNLHVDYNFGPVVPFLELNGTTWLGSADGTETYNTKLGSLPLTTAQDAVFAAGQTATLRWEGADVVNLGSQGVTGNTIVTLAAGMQFPITKNVLIGTYYEFPLSDLEEIFKQRVDVFATYTF